MMTTPTDKSDADEKNKPLTITQQLWVDFNALGGLITDLTDERTTKDGGLTTLRKMTITEFADRLGVNRDTLREWRRTIPNFWERVNLRRKELSPGARLARVHETWYLKAVKGDFQFLQLWLANFDDTFHTPNQNVTHDIGSGLMDALQIARQRQLKEQNATEGEVIDAATDNA